MIIKTQENKNILKNKQLTDSLLISCLTICESVISKKAYIEKKWCHDCKYYGGYELV